MKFFIYARKSTDDEERQILSIQAQLDELRELARKESLTVAREYIEAQTAKEPGRPVFNDMMKALEKGEAQAILSWHPDRLARNSIDGGRVIYDLDTGKLATLKFPTHWFENTPQGKFMLQIAFGQSKYYVDNLSENIKRGIRKKLRDGIYPNKPPIGYLNDPKTRAIVIDPERGPLVRRMFETYATGQYTASADQGTCHGMGLEDVQRPALAVEQGSLDARSDLLHRPFPVQWRGLRGQTPRLDFAGLVRAGSENPQEQGPGPLREAQPLSVSWPHHLPRVRMFHSHPTLRKAMPITDAASGAALAI